MFTEYLESILDKKSFFKVLLFFDHIFVFILAPLLFFVGNFILLQNIPENIFLYLVYFLLFSYYNYNVIRQFIRSKKGIDIFWD